MTGIHAGGDKVCRLVALRFLAALAAAFSLSFVSFNAVAQDAIPDSAEAGRIEQQFEQPEAPLSQFETLIPDSEEPMPAEDAARIKFTLSGVMVDGSTVYRDKEMLALYEDMLGTEISLADVFQIARRITVKYRGDGYILSRAVVPAQRIKAGVVVIQVIEGFISGVSVEGDILGPASLLESYAAKIMESRPLRADVLERYVLLADDLPGVDASSVLAPADGTPGASELILVIEHKEGDVFATQDNRGTRFVGPQQITTSIAINSGLGLYEKIGGRIITTPRRSELTLFGLDQEFQLGTEGTTLRTSFTGSKSRPGFTLRDLEVKSESFTGTLAVAHPLIRSRGENLSVSGTFAYKVSKTDLLGAVLTEDRLRTLNLGASYDFVDSWLGINLVTGSVTQGLDFLGASDRDAANISRLRGRSNFTKLNASALRLQRVLPGLSILTSAIGQWSAHTLLSAEEFGFGGAQFGRGYDPSEITGDYGMALKIEPQFGKSVESEFLVDYQLYGFYDYGMVWNTFGSPRQDAASAGFGVRTNITEWASGFAELAFPLTRPVASRGAGGKQRRFFFGFTVHN